MKLYEIRKDNLILADKVKCFKNHIFNVKGLMFTKPLKSGEGFLYISRNESIIETTIHMLFVFYPIDIIWLDSNKKIVDFKKNVLPFIPWMSPCKPAKYVLEVKRNTVKHLNIGDELTFKEL